jgi:hypothetical protein
MLHPGMTRNSPGLNVVVVRRTPPNGRPREMLSRCSPDEGRYRVGGIVTPSPKARVGAAVKGP